MGNRNDHHDEYLFTRDHRTPAQQWADRRQAAFGWLALVAFTAAVFVLASWLL